MGLSENSFKSDMKTIVSSYNNEQFRTSTQLAKHIWQLKERNTKHSITWKIMDRANPMMGNPSVITYVF